MRNPASPIVGLIPARGGSKSLPRKNLVPLAGRPLLAFTCETALASRRLDRVILSTDDPEIADLGRALGVQVPFLRPSELAADETPMIQVMQHALEWLASAGESPEALVLLQPTSPLRTHEDIDAAIELLFMTAAPTVVSIVEIPHNYAPESALVLTESRISPFLLQESATRRQDKQRFFARNGPAVLVTRSEVLRGGKLYGDPTVGYLMPKERSYDIDDSHDLEVIECLMSRGPGASAGR